MADAMKQVSDAVVSLLETGESQGKFTIPIQTERRWLFLKDLEELDGLSVQVVPVGSVRERLSNNSWVRFVRVDVLCKRYVPQSEITDGSVNRVWIDDHVSMLEEIDNYLADDDAATRDPETGVEYIEPGDKRVDRTVLSKLGVEFFEEALVENLFFGVVRVAYRVTETY